MSDSQTEAQTQSVVMEREYSHPPEKVWRALTEAPLIESWLMKNNFEAKEDRPFTLSADWGSVQCRVTTLDPITTLAYTWDAMGLESTVTWTLTPAGAGTHIRMEQQGFRPDQQQAYQGAQWGWQKFLTQLESTVATL